MARNLLPPGRTPKKRRPPLLIPLWLSSFTAGAGAAVAAALDAAIVRLYPNAAPVIKRGWPILCGFTTKGGLSSEARPLSLIGSQSPSAALPIRVLFPNGRVQNNHRFHWTYLPPELFFAILARKSLVKPKKPITSSESATSAWHFSYNQPAILDIDEKSKTPMQEGIGGRGPSTQSNSLESRLCKCKSLESRSCRQGPELKSLF